MMSSPKILIFGHSHMGALTGAYDQTDKKEMFELVFYQFLHPSRQHIVNLEGRWQYHPECLQELSRLIEDTQPVALISMLQGEQATLAGLVQPEKRFEFYLPGEEAELPEHIEIIPFDILVDTFKEHHSPIGPLIHYLRSSTSVPVYALCFPPTTCDADFFLKQAGDTLRDTLNDQRLAPARWRCRIWRVHALALQAIYHEHRVPFIDPPRASHDENNCLLEEFWSDGFHANSRYGHLLMQQVNDLIAEIV